MKSNYNSKIWLFLGAVFVLLTMSCSLFSQLLGEIEAEKEPLGDVMTVESNGITPAATEVVPPTLPVEPAQTEAPTQTEAPAPTVPPTATEVPPPAVSVPSTPCPDEVCVFTEGFWLARPIAPPGRDFIDVSYPFGSNNRGKSDVHHGVEFLNSQGTQVLAAADGVVVFAGDDLDTVFGLYRNFYGNFVVLEHRLPGLPEPVYTLYAHLLQFFVQRDDVVQRGQKIGEVGSSGAATGSHLHFEVRYGENNYQTVRNPELWLEPLTDRQGQLHGALAGRILDSQGNLVLIPDLVVERLSGPGLPASDTFYPTSYAERKLTGQGPWFESFAIGGLTPGEYQISFIRGGFKQRVVQVLPGQLTLVTFQLEE